MNTAPSSPLPTEQAKEIRFRELSPDELQLVKDLRETGDLLQALVNRLKREGADPRWTAIATTHFQEGLMASVRAVTKPTFF